MKNKFFKYQAQTTNNPIGLEILKAEGSYIYDKNNKKYLDFVAGVSASNLGHKNKKIKDAVIDQIEKYWHVMVYGEFIQEPTVKLCELISENLPNSLSNTYLTNSGTEAVLSAIRLARAFTGKNKIIKFAGCYHGHSDALLVAAGSGLATLSIPGSKGVPDEAVKNTLIAEFNNIDSVEAHLAKHKDIAAVIIEPIAGNMGVIQPNKDFIEELRELTKASGVLLIADEVMTGFRSQFGGAQELLGFEADITCLGKVVGGGFPVGAYGARNEIMEMVSPLGDMYQAGTLSGNPIAMACGIATLKELKKQNPYKDFEKTAAFLEREMKAAAKENGIDLQVNRFGSMLNPFFTKEKVVDFKTAQTSDTKKFKTFFWKMMENGVFLPPSQFESWFLATAMTKRDIYKVRSAVQIAMKAVANKHK